VKTNDLDVLVVGAGVSGLTSAVLLAESGFQVRIWSAERPEETTSFAAGAMWGPYLVEPVNKVQKWSALTLAELRTLASQPQSGVRLVAGVEASRLPVAPPEWADQLDGFRMCLSDELPSGFVTGWRFTAPIIDMPRYLDYLEDRFTGAGGVLEVRRLSTLRDASAVAPTIVNCTGLGARQLVPDPEVTAIKGQLVVVENPGITEFFSEDTGHSPDLLHIYPQGNTVVLGGLAVADDWSLKPGHDTAEAILARCSEIDLRLRGIRVIEHRVGLRPTRPEVRVELERYSNGTVVHNYGHGGAGVTLSWGCASEVVELLTVGRAEA
jgi:D-amino-acid oxidase